MRKLKKHTELREPGIRWFVWAFLVALLVWFFWDMPNDEFSHTRSVWMVIIALGPGLIGWLLCYYPIYKKKRSQGNYDHVVPVIDPNTPVYRHKTNHASGLPVPSGVPCEVVVYPSRLEFRAGGQKYVIPMERVVNANWYTEWREMAYWGHRSITAALFDTPKNIHYYPTVSKHKLVINFLAKNNKPKVILLSDRCSLFSLETEVNKHARCTVQCGENGKIEL